MTELRVGVAKVNRYASRDSGDTVEVVERPGGGLSVVVADAQGTGGAAKLLGSLVTARIVGLIKDGARDTAVHEAANDHLYHYKGGQVSCTLTTIAVDVQRRRCTVTRSAPNPAWVVLDGVAAALDAPSQPLGTRCDLAPVAHTEPLCAGLWVVVVTDGVSNAGTRSGAPVRLEDLLPDVLADAADPAIAARRILGIAIERDLGRPTDDMAVAVLGVLPCGEPEDVRTMDVRVPLRRDQVAE